MSILSQLRSTVDATIQPPWWHALSTLGWPTATLTTIATIQASRGSGFLGAHYPNVLTVLKAGPSHPAAGRVVRVLEGVVGATAEEGSDAPAKTSSPGPTCVPSWRTTAAADEATQLHAQLLRLIAQGAWWYASSAIVAFDRAYAACDIKRARSAYCAVLERFLERWVVEKWDRVEVAKLVGEEEERKRALAFGCRGS